MTNPSTINILRECMHVLLQRLHPDTIALSGMPQSAEVQPLPWNQLQGQQIHARPEGTK